MPKPRPIEHAILYDAHSALSLGHSLLHKAYMGTEADQGTQARVNAALIILTQVSEIVSKLIDDLAKVEEEARQAEEEIPF